MIIPTAEPFFFPGDDIGCLLIHGFTGAPKEMRWMGEYLAERGHTVLGIRLAGHATRREDLLRTKWTDWVDSAEDGWHMLNSASKQVYVIGLSMGGVLSLLLGSRFPVKGIVAMATPYDLPPDPRIPFLRLIHLFVPVVPSGESDWHDHKAEEEHISYSGYPTRMVLELKPLFAEMRAGLPNVGAPTLLMHSRQDGGVDPENMPKIYNDLGCEDKSMLWVENSGHVLTRDAARDQIFKAADDFIRRVSAP
ncbi:MAG: alpha/beta fold hydrolase [Anaerolineales bacterium]|nr:alpha/beta fold hydrolase [Chloroflexota bacterium]MBL6980482.1 alpha/beta fold hydrolase [Anaerolineales bacterium]